MLLFQREDRSVEAISPSRGPLCNSAGGLELLQAFGVPPPIARVQMVAFIDDIALTLHPSEQETWHCWEKNTECLRGKMNLDGVELNCAKSQALLPTCA